MQCSRCHYRSPLGEILLAADSEGLTGLWFAGQKHFAHRTCVECGEKNIHVYEQTTQWLDIYFSGQEPNFTPPLRLTGTTFQVDIWQLLLKIPYGKTTTYRELARKISDQRRLTQMSPQAVGGAVGHNAISIIIPCHRVVGSNGSLVGYAGGIDRKVQLLTLENVDITKYFTPQNRTKQFGETT
ncbi:MAG: methylated-DNA--[protein]-cysteine S-methyltransferase [Fretibacterium sp.]|nr:methylated-DNA--[protein]-cysteine S-methyltransferase [Fretibacterium sp.]